MIQHACVHSPLLALLAWAVPSPQLRDGAPPRGAEMPAVWSTWGDADGDALDDLYVVCASGEDRLFRNRGDGSFEDVTVAAGLAGRTGTQSAVWEDFDGDSRLDLLLVTSAGEVALYRGETGGTFRAAALELGLTDSGLVLRAEWVDYDGDGWLDLALVEQDRGPVFYHSAGGSAFERVELLGPAASSPSRIGVLPSGVARGAPTQGGGGPGAPRLGDAGGMRERTLTIDGGSGSIGAVASDPGRTTTVGPLPLDPPPPPPTCVLDEATLSCVQVSVVPQFGSLYPLGDEFSIAPDGDVTIGIAGGISLDPRRLHVLSMDPVGLAVLGESTATSGTAEGVRGESLSPAGRGIGGFAPSEGVRGEATAKAGTARGVHGVTASTEGEGVLGAVTATSGENAGVKGVSLSPDGRGIDGSAPGEGVRGEATAKSGVARGVCGLTASTEGEGVLGAVTATSGENAGVKGVSLSPDGRGIDGSAPGEGVRGEATAKSGVARGVCGITASTEGEGVLGVVTAPSGDSVGVRGINSSPDGRGVEGQGMVEGVRGIALGTSPSGAYGVRGTQSSPFGAGVLGESVGPMGGAGVLGLGSSLLGTGIRGEAPAPTGPGGPSVLAPIGVHGVVNALSGRGVLGEALADDGPTSGVHGRSQSKDRESAGVLAEGDGFEVPGDPAAAALEIRNGAIVVSGDARPAGVLVTSGAWTAMRSCGGSPATQQTVGHYLTESLVNELIVPDSVILLTVDASTAPSTDTCYFAQVIEVMPGEAEIRISAVGNVSPSTTCSLPPFARVNYLILNPAPGP